MSKHKIPTTCPHCGKLYNSIKEKCNDHNIPIGVYCSRIEHGWDEITAITKPVRCVEDHMGNKFASTADMCRHYHIARGTFYDRKKRSLSLEECLLGEKKYKGENGAWFSTKREMLAEYNVSSTYFYQKRKENAPLVECLTNSRSKKKKGGTQSYISSLNKTVKANGTTTPTTYNHNYV